MKVYISADIEGVTTTTSWSETDKPNADYGLHMEQMTKEVVAACEGAIAAGADEIIIKDAHDSGRNININALPENAVLMRGWSGHPYAMVDRIDSSFDACMFIGYHSAAGRCGNPLSHTYSGSNIYTKLNGRICSEFMLYSYAAALEGVPSVFLSGDKMLCEDYADLHPSLITVPVKDGMGGLSINLSPKKTLKMIRQNTEAALKQDLSKAKLTLPDHFCLEICYKEHRNADKASYYPDVKRVSDNIVMYETGNYFDLLRAFSFII